MRPETGQTIINTYDYFQIRHFEPTIQQLNFFINFSHHFIHTQIKYNVHACIELGISEIFKLSLLTFRFYFFLGLVIFLYWKPLLPSQLISHNFNLLILLFGHQLLMENNSLTHKNVFNLLLIFDFLEAFLKLVNQSSNIFIRSELSTITNRYTTERALFLSKSIVRLDTIRAKPMQA